MVFRVQFVDDEPRVLEGLLHVLFPQRGERDRHFATSCREARKHMEGAMAVPA